MVTESARRPETLKVVTTATDGITVITVTGEIDQNSAPPLTGALQSAARGERPRIVVDMRQVTFIDSSGINDFLTARRDLAAAGGWLRLAGVPDRVLRILTIVGLDTVIGCYPSLRDALNAPDLSG
ncbi:MULTISPECIES: STAS domain-containing protein [unclassified Streptomyces]|uniref:STAS domain-containing protein n=1 Tax=unclassified Streptomyces TaxID=2593676 RepID=UPI00093A0BAA|nr:STAS domain-containing protein [Streptomyces sp. CB01883]OKJ74372.1 hypothetical protein AMK32_35875 [Streptomyces sp. CB01883]